MEEGEDINDIEYRGEDNYSKSYSENVADPTIAHLQIVADEVIEDYKRELLGFFKDKDGNIVIIDQDPLCNENGANKLVSYVRATVSKVVTLSNLSEKEKGTILLGLANSLTVQIGVNYKEYGIDSRILKQIKELTMTYIQSNLSRALRGFTAKLLSRSTQTSEVRSMNEKKKGILGGFR